MGNASKRFAPKVDSDLSSNALWGFPIVISEGIAAIFLVASSSDAVIATKRRMIASVIATAIRLAGFGAFNAAMIASRSFGSKSKLSVTSFVHQR
jgi:hypothetical protein